MLQPLAEETKGRLRYRVEAGVTQTGSTFPNNGRAEVHFGIRDMRFYINGIRVPRKLWAFVGRWVG